MRYSGNTILAIVSALSWSYTTLTITKSDAFSFIPKSRCKSVKLSTGAFITTTRTDPTSTTRSTSLHLLPREYMGTTTSTSSDNDDDDIASSSSATGATNNPLNDHDTSTKAFVEIGEEIPKDIVIIGGGLAGLSAALYITNKDRAENNNYNTRKVTILEKADPIGQMSKTTAGSFAAAGMLAPNSERLPSGPLLDLCLKSRELYTEFVRNVEGLAKHSCTNDSAGAGFLWNNADNNGSGDSDYDIEGNGGLEPWEVGYCATGGFLAPAFPGDVVATWSPPASSQETAKWLDDVQVHEMEPSLHPDVIGGWWFPEDASVDARRLTCSLRAACFENGVEFLFGEGCGAASLELRDGKCKEIRLEDGRALLPKSVVVANGSWMRNLLPVPITPHKGQSFSVRMPSDQPPLLSRVLFAQDTYIVPKADGRIVIGATVEAGSFDPNVTPAGMAHCISNAMQLVPGLDELPMEEAWVGLRPTTPDKGPLLGRTDWDNMFIAGGYWRNGVLLAPKTGQLIGDLVLNNGETLDDEEDEALVKAFNWDRFTRKGGGKELAANARYAASMHPVHKRSSGMGVAAAVGTELGFYSGAGSAVEERKRDRDTGGEGDDEAFENAARLGVSDASAFLYDDGAETTSIPNVDTSSNDGDEYASIKDESLLEEEIAQSTASGEEKSQGYDETTFDGYQTIQTENSRGSRDKELEAMKKARLANSSPMGNFSNDGISASEFDAFEEAAKLGMSDASSLKYDVNDDTTPPIPSTTDIITDEYDNIKSEVHVETESPAPTPTPSTTDETTTFDGYTAIQAANSRNTRQEELDAMRQARIANRVKVSEIDEAKIGVMKMPETFTEQDDDVDADTDSEDNKLSDLYSQIKKNKQAANMDGVDMEEMAVEEKPDPGFRIYRIDSETREKREIPPYTSPLEMEAIIAEEKKNLSSPPSLEPNYEEDIETNSNLETLEPVISIEEKEQSVEDKEDQNLSDLYSQIKSNKQAASMDGVDMEEMSIEDKPDPGFRIYRVDSESREMHEVPPYTSPLEMEALISEGKIDPISSINEQTVEANDVLADQIAADNHQDIPQVEEENISTSIGETAVNSNDEVIAETNDVSIEQDLEIPQVEENVSKPTPPFGMGSYMDALGGGPSPVKPKPKGNFGYKKA